MLAFNSSSFSSIYIVLSFLILIFFYYSSYVVLIFVLSFLCFLCLFPDHPTFSEICEAADQRLFRSNLQNPDHVLHQRLPPVEPQSYTTCTNDHMIGLSPSAKVHYSGIHLLFECFIKILTDYVLSSTSNFPDSLVYF